MKPIINLEGNNTTTVMPEKAKHLIFSTEPDYESAAENIEEEVAEIKTRIETGETFTEKELNVATASLAGRVAEIYGWEK